MSNSGDGTHTDTGARAHTHAGAETDAQAWLDARTPVSPAALQERMRAAVSAVGNHGAPGGRQPLAAGAVPATLAEASLYALGIALEKCDERAAAPDLLAADALLTYAMEAAGEMGAEAVEGLAEAYGGSRLVALLGDGA